jgi:spore maturation protein CgeB
VKSIPHYDVLVTTKSYEVEDYQRLGARNLFYIQQGYDPDFLHPYELSDEESDTYGCDVVFIGRQEEHYVRAVRAAMDVTDRVRVWGLSSWRKALPQHSWLETVYTGRAVFGEEYGKALCGAKIALGLLSRHAQVAPDLSTTRTYEIPACGTFMLAERTSEHEALFAEDREAAFFEGYEELREKIRYYLDHDEERQRIAAAGRERCLRSGYTYQGRFEELFEQLDRSGLLD